MAQNKLAMTMISSANSLVVFDKQPDATCINPLTQAPNAINLTPELVTPDRPLVIELVGNLHLNLNHSSIAKSQ